MSPSGPVRDAARTELRSDLIIYLTLVLLTLAAWWVSAQGWFTSWSRVGYWLGVAGGVSMLLLFTYPLRKRWRVTYGWGATRYWFIVHMVLGVMGPWLILLHSTFQIGSTNAAVALYSMIVVALSGVAGRFLYVRLHAGLRGEKASLAGMRAAMSQAHQEADAHLQGMPEVLDALHAFETAALSSDQAGKGGWWWRLAVLPVQRRRVVRQCRQSLKQGLAHHKSLGEQIDRYALAVQRAAQFQTFERLFSMWHVAHVPFVWIMVLCAIFHVIAVHAY
ncbi:MAG TPA: hypothetical protein VFW84_08370 [Aquabacterium sp.]|jgi:hypothetical protein|uniref:hypothetical protein n=1 Tax=Aquabacterium sp. TaxID=1872578 RepID=UPI002E360262|nr:hypothetical protein [Aquabacterium sp.]HEX5372736.1 hypothetical protein [Aquabacterium sp.]